MRVVGRNSSRYSLSLFAGIDTRDRTNVHWLM